MSADNTMRVVSGTYDPLPFDEKQSVLPKWLLDRGLMNYYDFLKSRTDFHNEIKEAERRAGRKGICKCERRSVRSDIRHARDDLRKFSIEYFEVKDVEKAFRELLGKEGTDGKSRNR